MGDNFTTKLASNIDIYMNSIKLKEFLSLMTVLNTVLLVTHSQQRKNQKIENKMSTNVQ